MRELFLFKTIHMTEVRTVQRKVRRKRITALICQRCMIMINEEPPGLFHIIKISHFIIRIFGIVQNKTAVVRSNIQTQNSMNTLNEKTQEQSICNRENTKKKTATTTKNKPGQIFQHSFLTAQLNMLCKAHSIINSYSASLTIQTAK